MSSPLLGHGPRGDLETETFTLAVGTLVGHTDRGGWRVGSDEAAAGHVVATPYRKAQKAHDRADSERWEEAEVAATLDAGNNTKTAHAIAVNMQNAGTGELSGTLQAEAQRRGNRGYGVLAHALRAEGADASEDGTGRGTPLVAMAETLDAGYARTTDSAGSNGAGPRNVALGTQGLSVRRLTPVECERLQGFPDGWTAGESASARYRTLGNAVCVPVVEWIARRLGAVESLR